MSQDGGPGQFAVVTLAVAPRERGAGFQFVDAIRGGSVPKEFILAVRKGVEGSLERGLSRGRANTTMHFAHSAAVPPAIAQQIAKESVKDGRRSRVSGSAVSCDLHEEAFRRSATEFSPAG